MIIVGGGATGAALALAAKDAALLAAKPPPSGKRYYALNAASVRFLTKAAGESFSDGATVNQFLLCAGGQKHRLVAKDDSPLCKIVGEDFLLEWLRRMLHKKGAKVYDDSPLSFAADKNDIRARMPDGREFVAPLLVVADGARSTAATKRNVGAAVSFFGQRALTALFAVSELQNDVAAQWFALRDVLAFLPIGGGVFAMVWSMPEVLAQSFLSADDCAAKLAKAAAERSGFSVVPADDCAPRSFILASSRRAVRAAYRTAFVGDSARTIHPLAGQGLNIGLADCNFLLQCLHRHNVICNSVGDSVRDSTRNANRDSIDDSNRNGNQNSVGDSTAAVQNALAEYARGGMRGEMLHGMTALLNCFGGLAAPLFFAASRRAFARPIARFANR